MVNWFALRMKRRSINKRRYVPGARSRGRAPPSEGGGHTFESCRVRQISKVRSGHIGYGLYRNIGSTFGPKGFSRRPIGGPARLKSLRPVVFKAPRSASETAMAMASARVETSSFIFAFSTCSRAVDGRFRACGRHPDPWPRAQSAAAR